MTSWQNLQVELNLWVQADRQVRFWWRDDDAATPSPALEHLIKISKAHQVPLALAVIPTRATSALAAQLEQAPLVSVLQHGFSHTNHAPPDEKKQEFGPHRTRKAMLADIYAGSKLLAPFSRRCAVFVPPWNRMDKKLLAVLPGLGIRGISTFAPRNPDQGTPGLEWVNSHIDPVNWSNKREFLGEAAVIEQIITHLANRRTGRIDADEPTGLLTHHLVHDEAAWAFVEHLVDLTFRCSAVKWLSAGAAFGFEK